MKNIVVFASGSGTNAENIVNYFEDSDLVRIVRIYVNNPKAFVLQRAEKLGIETFVFSREDFYSTDKVLEMLREDQADLIVLSGFLWKVPEAIINEYPHRIINIHPALLPSYGGKGMYGDRVHEAVLAAGEKKSGITIHYVNDKYDDGECIFQARCDVLEGDDAHSLAERVHALEYEHFPVIIEGLVRSMSKQ